MVYNIQVTGLWRKCFTTGFFLKDLASLFFDPFEENPMTRSFSATLAILLAVLLVVSEAASFRTPTPQDGFKTMTTRTNDGLPFERYCGYLMKVGHGTVTFEEGEVPLQIAYLLFRDSLSKPSITKVIYGEPERLRAIQPNQYYDIGVRKYDEGWSFPRRLDVVESCTTWAQ